VYLLGENAQLITAGREKTLVTNNFASNDPDVSTRGTVGTWADICVDGRGLHSSTFRLNVSTFCRIRWVHDFPPVH
jgi:hypothetical protein